jgi:hypothetical protein
MNDFKYVRSPLPEPPPDAASSHDIATAGADARAADTPAGDATQGVPAAVDAAATEAPALNPAVEKFRSCRWRAAPDMGEYCTHRDVLPFAGKEGFKPESWCPECAFYKLRRTPKKRERVDYTY